MMCVADYFIGALLIVAIGLHVSNLMRLRRIESDLGYKPTRWFP